MIVSSRPRACEVGRRLDIGECVREWWDKPDLPEGRFFFQLPLMPILSLAYDDSRYCSDIFDVFQTKTTASGWDANLEYVYIMWSVGATCFFPILPSASTWIDAVLFPIPAVHNPVKSSSFTSSCTCLSVLLLLLEQSDSSFGHLPVYYLKFTSFHFEWMSSPHHKESTPQGLLSQVSHAIASQKVR